ncbi:MAG: BON domain-containing protein [Methylobacter sp.]
MQITGINNIDESVSNPGGRMSAPTIWAIVLASGMAMAAGAAQARDAAALQVAAGTGLEDTGRNVRDRDNRTVTPQKQKAGRGDTKITAAIRRGIVNNKSLSTNAHNVKIITRNGAVTLRGPVENGAEKAEVQAIAEKVKGVARVDNQLEAKAP